MSGPTFELFGACGRKIKNIKPLILAILTGDVIPHYSFHMHFSNNQWTEHLVCLLSPIDIVRLGLLPIF